MVDPRSMRAAIREATRRGDEPCRLLFRLGLAACTDQGVRFTADEVAELVDCTMVIHALWARLSAEYSDCVPSWRGAE